MLSVAREVAAKDLLEYGEEDAARWIILCGDDEFIQVCGVADWIMLYGPTTPSSAGMFPGRAVAAAAVFVREGEPRKLVRSRRKKLADLPSNFFEKLEKEDSPSLVEQRWKGKFYGVTEELKDFGGNSRVSAA